MLQIHWHTQPAIGAKPYLSRDLDILLYQLSSSVMGKCVYLHLHPFTVIWLYERPIVLFA